MESISATHEPTPSGGPARTVIASAGLLALFSASCCVLPIGLSLIGLGGSWLVVLGPFVGHRLETLLVVGVILAWSWFRLWRRWPCAARRRSTLVILVIATLAFALAVSAPLWEAEATRVMFALWREART